MRHPTVLFFLFLLVTEISAWNVGTYGDHLSPHDAVRAMKCLQENYCNKHSLPKVSNIRCKVNDVVVYVCNYAGRGTKHGLGQDHQNPCSLYEMKKASVDIRRRGWKQAHESSRYMSGWWHEPSWKKTYGFEKSCGSHDCERHCDNNFNPWKKDVYFDFDMECTYSVESGTKCQRVSGESVWDIKPRSLPPTKNSDH